MFAPLIAFTFTVLFILAGFFALSYLVWSDKAKTPEVIAAELSMFSEQLSHAVILLGICGAVSLVTFACLNLLSQIN